MEKRAAGFSDKARAQLQGEMQRSVFLGGGEFLILKSRAALMGILARALMTRDIQESKRLLNSKTEEALKRGSKAG